MKQGMKMGLGLEVHLSESLLVSGEVILVDESFDHEFGTAKREGYEVENLELTTWIDGIDYLVPVTEALREVAEAALIKAFNEGE